MQNRPGSEVLDVFRSAFTVSALTRWVAISIVLAASFMRQIHTLAKSVVPVWLISLFVWCGFILAIVALLRILLRGASKQSLLAFATICCAALGLALTMDLMEERVHILEYGFLGFLVARDMRSWPSLRVILNSLMFCTVVAGADELFQGLLPYRVGDLRDTVFDVVSAGLGAALYLTTRAELEKFGN